MPFNRMKAPSALVKSGVAQCLPASATFYHARRLCEALDSVVPTPQQALQCCRMGCYSAGVV